jgi:hypothetical protein
MDGLLDLSLHQPGSLDHTYNLPPTLTIDPHCITIDLTGEGPPPLTEPATRYIFSKKGSSFLSISNIFQVFSYYGRKNIW